MLVADDFAVDLGFDGEFFPKLTDEGGAGLLAMFDLAAGELPFEFMPRATLALADEDPALLFDDGGNDDHEKFSSPE